MKKQTKQKLRLAGETIRKLQHAELIQVVGGVNVSVGGLSCGPCSGPDTQ